MSFQGSLNELPLSDIVQLVAASGKTGMFSMTRASEKGYVYLQNGQITHAKLGEGEGANGPVTLTPLEWKVVTKADGSRSIVEIARALRTSAFDIAKTLYGLVTAELVEIGKARGGDRAAPQPPAPAPLSAIPPPTGQSIPNVSTHSGAFQALSKGDEKRSLQILCTKVKQEAEAAAAAPGDATIDRPYRTALLELDRGRGLDVARELIRTLEEMVEKLRGHAAARGFREKMNPLL